MTWSVEYATQVKEFARHTGDVSVEVETAKEQALKCVDEIIESGVLGDPAADYNVRVVGHANPQTITPSGLSEDYVQITVTKIGEMV